MPRRRGRVAVVVDPYSQGSGLATGFRERGVDCVAVLSPPEPPEVVRASWRPENYVRTHHFTGDLRALAEAVAAEDPLCIVAGADSGVELADALLELIRPGTGNAAGLTAARRDKHHMALALKGAGVPHLRHVCSDRPGDIERWIHATGATGRPLVIKPPKSGGTDDVYLVRPGEDWRPYFHRLLGKVNLLGVRNDAVLVQEYADGVEYIVDTYSVDGEHGVVEVCRYTKDARQDRIGIYDCVDFLAPDDPTVTILFGYTRRVLDALGFRNGPCHAEVMLTAKGPVLIEVGARPAGGVHQHLSRLATGDCQLDRCVRHHVDGEFRPGYELVRHVRAAFLSSKRAGILRNAEILDAVDELPTVHGKRLLYRTGHSVPATVDFFTTLGHVIFVAEDERQIRADFGALKSLEAQLRVEPIVERDASRQAHIGA